MFTPLISLADLGPPAGYHSVSLCTKIVYQKEFPDVFVVSQFTGAMNTGKEGTIVEDGDCVSGYKASTLNVYYLPKNKLASIDLKNLRIDSNRIASDLFLLKSRLDHFGGFIEDSNPIVEETREYTLTKNPAGKISLYKSKEIFKYNNGDPVKVKTYPNPNPIKKTETKKDQEEDKDKENYGQGKKNIEEPKDFKPIEVQQKKKKGFWYRFMCAIGLSKEC